MKKVIILLLTIFLLLGLVACNSNPATDNGNQNNSSQNRNNSQQSNEEKLDLTGIPQYWIDLFTFDNVTILLKNNITIKKGDEYRCVDGNWYYKYQSSEEFESHSGRHIFDIYLTNNSIFEYDEINSCYKVSGNTTIDDSGFTRDITINVNEGKITYIEDLAISGSLTVVSTLEFSNYGTTTIA